MTDNVDIIGKQILDLLAGKDIHDVMPALAAVFVFLTRDARLAGLDRSDIRSFMNDLLDVSEMLPTMQITATHH